MGKKIFISHSSKDKKLVKNFINKILVCGIEISSKDIFCTSVDGLTIESGEDWRQFINSNMRSSKVIILFLTPNYKESEICLNEMGAAWAMEQSLVIPVVVDPINFSKIGIVFEVKQAVNIIDSSSVDRLRDKLLDVFSIKKTKTDRWNDCKFEFIELIKAEIAEHPFQTALSREIFEKIKQENADLHNSYKNLVKEKQKLLDYCDKLEKMKNINEVRKAQVESGLLDNYKLFLELSNEISNMINQFGIVIRDIIFNDYTSNYIEIDRYNHIESISRAVAQGIIDEEMNLNRNHPTIKEIILKLDEYSNFLNNADNNNVLNKLSEKYNDIIVEIKNLDFWENVLKISL